MLAFEVKSGTGYKTHAAMDNALAVKDYQLDEAYVLAECNVAPHGKVLYLPIYAAGVFENH